MSLKGLYTVSIKRAGKPVRHYIYAWRGGPRIMTKVGGPRPALDAEALALYTQAVAERTAPGEGTIGALCRQWRASAAWAAMAPSTRRQWGYVLSEIEAKWKNVPLAVFEHRGMRGKIVAWRDEVADRPRKADYRIQVLSALLGYGRLTGQITHNRAEGVPGLYKGGQRQEVIWLPAEVEAWQRATQAVRDAVNLARLTGLRRGDLVAVPLDAVGDNSIVWRTGKSGKRAIVAVPILPALKALIAELRERPRKEGVQTILVNSHGKSWTPDGLESSFGDEREKLGLPAKHLHDFRGTFCTELCRARLSNEEIGRIMGWPPSQVETIRRLYVDDAAVVVALSERMAGNVG